MRQLRTKDVVPETAKVVVPIVVRLGFRRLLMIKNPAARLAKQPNVRLLDAANARRPIAARLALLAALNVAAAKAAAVAKAVVALESATRHAEPNVVEVATTAVVI